MRECIKHICMDNFSIRAVALRTGISPYVLRAWELRYAAVKPVRTPKGHRRYTAEQVERLEWLRLAQAAGHSIGAIASLPTEELMRLAGEHQHLGNLFITDALDALKTLDPALLDHEFDRALQSLGRLELIDGFVFPLLVQVHKAIDNGMLRPAHLSFAQVRLREFLSILTSSITVSDDAPRLVLASASGLEHEPGLLGSAIFAAASGWRPIRFSPGTPAEELVFAATANRAQAIVYSIVMSSQTSGAIAEAILLRRLAPPELPVMFGGRLDALSSQALIQAGLERMQNMNSLRVRLEALVIQHTSGMYT